MYCVLCAIRLCYALNLSFKMENAECLSNVSSVTKAVHLLQSNFYLVEATAAAATAVATAVAVVVVVIVVAIAFAAADIMTVNDVLHRSLVLLGCFHNCHMQTHFSNFFHPPKKKAFGFQPSQAEFVGISIL